MLNGVFITLVFKKKCKYVSDIFLQVNLCLIVANSRYSSNNSDLLSVEKDMHCMKKFLEEEHSFEVHVIPNSKDILDDVMKFTRGLSDEKKGGLANFHFYYSGIKLRID